MPRENTPAVVEHPCAACGVGAPWVIWDNTRICVDCFSKYNAEVGPRLAGLVNAADAVKWTREWVAKRAKETEAA